MAEQYEIVEWTSGDVVRVIALPDDDAARVGAFEPARPGAPVRQADGVSPLPEPSHPIARQLEQVLGRPLLSWQTRLLEHILREPPTRARVRSNPVEPQRDTSQTAAIPLPHNVIGEQHG